MATSTHQTLAHLRAFHHMGRVSLQQRPHRLPYGQAASDAARVGVHQEMLRKARQFAAAYTRQELDDLVKSCRDAGYALGKGQIEMLMRLPRPLRHQLQRQAISQHWSKSDLERAIRRRLPLRRYGGHRPKPPVDLVDACVQVRRLCVAWRGLQAALQRPPAGGAKPLDRKLPLAARKAVEAATRMMARLERLAERVVERERERD